ncbi:hypothetical protein RBTH_08188 [Bacillus thuringiensis serovar israelensis ATCC 35646]|nr:hypothetical protein RBTH_08188 [Bacillus thuringiensis serovar israelensis ATCC 35646]
MLTMCKKRKYIWWLSIGDCLVYVFHEELHKLGQYALNQRHFYEWIGNVTHWITLFWVISSVFRELRTGRTRIVMLDRWGIRIRGTPDMKRH